MRHPKATHNPNTPELMNKGLREEEHVRKLNYLDMDRFTKLVRRYTGGSLLDAGCLNSPVCAEMKAKYLEHDFYALDHACDVVAHFQKLCPNVNYVCSDAYAMPFKDEFFDYIVAAEILEHLDRPEDFIDELYRLMKPGAVMAFTVPKDEWGRQQGGELHVNWFRIDEVAQMFPKFKSVELEEYDCGAAVKFIMGWVQK